LVNLANCFNLFYVSQPSVHLQMKETILKALLQLFAIIANVDKEGISETARKIIESYLRQHLNRDQLPKYLNLFEEFLNQHHRTFSDKESTESRKKRSSDSVKVLMMCQSINEGLQQEEKILVFLRLLEFVNEDHVITKKEYEFIETVSETFNITEEEYKNLLHLVLDENEDKIIPENLLIIDKADAGSYPGVKHIPRKNLEGKLVFLHIDSSDTFLFKYVGEITLFRNTQSILPGRSYIMDSGSVIRSGKIEPVYFGDVAGKFLQISSQTDMVFSAIDLEYKFRNSENGIQPLNFTAKSGQLVGIMGGSGTGKSTLLNLLNGNLKPKNGKVLLNGVDLNGEEEKMEGIIGYVPQDDLLIEELTVFQNLYFNAKLCFSDYSDRQILKTVIRILRDLDLNEIKHLKVGDPLNKTISGGQRKRLNIGLELMREPSVLFVDEPTSGLSSMDSEMVMLLLKEQTLRGKLVMVNIHQPSSFIYKLFDRLLILDKGGFPIYQGNPLEAVVYFKKMSEHVNADESQCVTCGNVNPEQVLQIIETKFVNQYGKFTGSRRVAPREWYQLYKENLEKGEKSIPKVEKLPETHFNRPGKGGQFKIFTLRNILSKLSNTQYLLVNFLEAPILAVIIGYFTKYISGTLENPDAYVFAENDNLPAYLFMSVVVALFIGMTVSAEEIIRDARLLKRESFLHLSRFSYLNSKVLVLFVISAIQMLSFVVLGNLILEIREMTISFWMILFTTACLANMIGLSISSAFNSVVTIYILIPLILVPQLLFSGAIVPFDKLHKKITTSTYVPIIGDLMTSRWAYEALTVEQFKKNPFQREFFESEQRVSEASYYTSFLIPRLKIIIDNLERNFEKEKKARNNRWNLEILKTELDKLGNKPEVSMIFAVEKMSMDSFSLEVANEAELYLDFVRVLMEEESRRANEHKDKQYGALVEKLGSPDAVLELRNQNHNHASSDILLNRTLINIIQISRNKLIRKKDPIYMIHESRIGRAHLYSSVKRLGDKLIDTTWFNICLIWITSLVLYILLYFDRFKMLVSYFEGIRIRRRG